jgi:hypothetical protein
MVTASVFFLAAFFFFRERKGAAVLFRRLHSERHPLLLRLAEARHGAAAGPQLVSRPQDRMLLAAGGRAFHAAVL